MVPWGCPDFDDHEQVCAFSDAATGLKGIIAVHDTTFGPAVGGTRFFPYSNDRSALSDVLRLSRAMSYKSALAGLPCGGGKAVIIGNPAQLKTRELLQSYGRVLNRLGTSFATAEDVGISIADCEVIREVSPYVAGLWSGSGDPSEHTAKGVFHGLKAVLRRCLGSEEFDGVHFAVQGLGNVGWALCQQLYEAGAKLTVADIRTDRVAAAQQAFGADAAAPDDIHRVQADVFSPCALGGVINDQTVDQLKARAVAGAANNQLATPECGKRLHDRGILFAPDFILNAGGVIGGVADLSHLPGRIPMERASETSLEAVRDRLAVVLNCAEAERRPPEQVATDRALELLGRKRRIEGVRTCAESSVFSAV